MKDYTQQYAIIRESYDAQENRAARTTLRHKAMRHDQSALNPLNGFLSFLPRLFFEIKRALGFNTTVAPTEEIVGGAPSLQAPRYIVRGVEIVGVKSALV